MRIFKSHPLLKLVNSYMIDSPQPSNLSYLWNFGSLLAVCLVIQIITGVTLAMHYNPSVLEAFNSVEHKQKYLFSLCALFLLLSLNYLVSVACLSIKGFFLSNIVTLKPVPAYSGLRPSSQENVVFNREISYLTDE